MTRAGGGLLLAAVLAVGACAAGSKLDTLDSQLGTLSKENTEASRTKLAALASQAQADAKSSDGVNRVAFYRVAAVSAWQAGAAGQSQVLPITDEGIAACDALPAKDKSAPRDCALIRLAAPLAVQDDLTRQLATLQGHAAGGKLPNADLQRVQGVFDGLETQFDKVSTIRAEVVTLDVPNDFKLRTDRQRLIVYCNAVKAWSLYGDVDGASLDTFNALAQRKKQMTDRLEVDGIATDCRAIPTTQGFDDK